MDLRVCAGPGEGDRTSGYHVPFTPIVQSDA